jgi:hypothetical protein
MSQAKEEPGGTSVRYAHEILLSLNLALALVSVVEIQARYLMTPFFSLEFSVHKLLHVHETDFISGYIALSFSSMALAFCIWLVLRLSAGSEVTKAFLRYWAGIVVLVAPSAFWLYSYQKYGWPFGWPYRWAPFELSLALLCTQLYVARRWRFPAWFSVLLLVAHFAYWFWVAGGGIYFAPNYAGPAAPVLGFCSAVAWGVYVQCLGPNRAHYSDH